ncbi:STAS domain-containing protein [Actinokineospora iranica]|uniref:Anti-sigma factor antagonist n=1 Tax=Actinokineospora iranica TaxID=1271860 RepID=A0A1G6WJV8_9PSEU|nr:STAS domain-containing protein [Actinokineospora iranica]SDD66108.1 anti-sigma B factor antagonist [Actinokineospora iranica]
MNPDPPPLAISHLGDPGAADHRLVIRGELDYMTAPDLTAALGSLRLHSGSTLTLDLAGLGFCDSTGLSVLLGAHKRMASLGGKLTVSAIDPNLARVLTITGLAHLFTPVETTGEPQGLGA